METCRSAELGKFAGLEGQALCCCRLFRMGELDAGQHSFLWTKPHGLSAGMYECTTRMNGQVDHTGIIIEP